jgi:putative addiction module component (TIGR02574 family)
MTYDREELFNLPTQEKLKLVEALWDSIEEGYLKEDTSIEAIKKELDRRSKFIEEFPESLIPWEKVKAKMNMR